MNDMNRQNMDTINQDFDTLVRDCIQDLEKLDENDLVAVKADFLANLKEIRVDSAKLVGRSTSDTLYPNCHNDLGSCIEFSLTFLGTGI
jgi:hypothetical protein